jgi:hypothetical protein
VRIKVVSLSVCVCVALCFNETLCAQGTAFTYQGELNSGGDPANGLYDFTFTIFSTSNGASPATLTLTNSAVAVTNGLFTTILDFGGSVFNGNPAWLEIAVSTNDDKSFTTLSPRELLTPKPYAIFANTASNLSGTLPSTQLSGTLPSSRINGTYSGAVNFQNIANSFSGNGVYLTGLNASQLTIGTVADARLSTNVALLNGAQTFSGTNMFTNFFNQFVGQIIATNDNDGNYALTVHGPETNTGPLYVGWEGSTPFGIILGTDGGIHSGGYIDLSANNRIYALSAMQSFMADISCDVPLGIIIYDGAPSLVTFDQIEGGLATNYCFPNGTMTFTLGQYGQVILNNPLYGITNEDKYIPEFDAPQLVFQNERLITGGVDSWTPTNFFGILQTQAGLSFGQITNPTVVTSTGGTTKNVLGNMRSDLLISTNGSITIYSNLVVDGTIRANGSGVSDVVVSEVVQASSYTAAATDEMIIVNATGLTITLPTAVGIKGHTFIVKLTAPGSAKVATILSQNIDGASTYTLSAQYKYVRLTSDNVNWLVTGNN